MKKSMTSGIIAGAVALAISGAMATDAKAEGTDDKEKCYGVAKAGHNDCGDADKTHSCMGQATVDGDGAEWLAVPKGLCDRLVGGSTVPMTEEDRKHMKDHKGEMDDSDES